MTQSELEALALTAAANALVAKAASALAAAERPVTAANIARLANGWTNPSAARAAELTASIVALADEYIKAVEIVRFAY